MAPAGAPAAPAASAAPAQPPAALAPPAFRLGDSVRPLRYAATLAVDPGAERFSGELSIDLRLSERTQAIWLHARHLEVGRAELAAGGETLRATAHLAGGEYLGVWLPAAVGPGEARLVLSYRGKISSTEWSGLFRQQAGGAWYAFTQLEPSAAREVFPCFDEPGFKVPWQLTLKVPRGLMAASNTPAEAEEEAGDLRVFRFAPTRPLPSYLVAFAVGPFERVDAGRWGQGRTPVQVLALAGRAREAGLASELIGPLLERMEGYFGLPYAYGKLDFVAVPIFFGAMENPGLVTFGAESLLVRPEAVTPFQRRTTAYVAAHEIAHQWFGNLATMAWWDDLWLNESFADWLADRILREWQPGWERDVFRIASVRASAMSADSRLSAPPVRQPVSSQRDLGAGGGEYAIVYSKGREVLTMAEGWLGPEKFRAGVRRHISSHADGNATAADLFAALSAEAGAGVAPVLTTFLDQSGLPLVSAELRCPKGQPPALHLSQRRYLRLGMAAPDQRRWKIPLCVRYPAGDTTARACALLEGAEQDVPLTEAKSCPAWVVPNDGQLGYYRVAMSPELWARLLGGAAPLTRAERAGFLDDLFALVRSGDVPVADALAQVPAAVASGDRHLITLSARFVDGLAKPLVSDALRPKYARMAREIFGPGARALGLRPRPQDDEGAKLVRGDLLDAAGRLGEDAALRKEARRLAAAWLADRKALEVEVAQAVLGLAADGGDAQLYERLSAAALQTQDRRERRLLLGAMGRFRSPELVRRNLDLLLGSALDTRDTLGPLLFGALNERGVRELAYDFVRSNWDALAARLPKSQAVSLFLAGEIFCDAARRKEVEASFAPHAATLPQGERLLARTLESIDHCVALRERQQASAAAFLQRY